MDWIEVLKIIVPGAVSIVVAWLGGRAAGKQAGAKEGADLAARVKTLEDNEPADLAAARKDASQALALATTAGTEAAQAKALAQTARDDLARHLTDEEKRRDLSRELGQRRDDGIAAQLTTIARDINEQGKAIAVLESRVDLAGASRRGR